MDSEPKALRPFLLVATTFVVIGCAAGFALWMFAHQSQGGTMPQAPADLSKVSTRPVDFLPDTPPEQRARLTKIVEAFLVESSTDRRGPERELSAAGEAAVPPLLTALHRITQDPRGLSAEAPRLQIQAIDRVLNRIRRIATPEVVMDPWRMAPDSAWLLQRAKSWFAWWDSTYGKQYGKPPK